MTYPPGYDPYAQPHPPPQKKRPWPLLIALAVVLTLTVVVCAAMFGRDQARRGEPTAPTPNKTMQAAPAQPQKAVSKAPAKKKAATSIGDGTFIVGKDVAAGQYKTPGAAERIISFCAWSTARDDSFDKPIDLGSASEVQQPGFVTLKTGYYFKTTGCQPWVRQ